MATHRVNGNTYYVHCNYQWREAVRGDCLPSSVRQEFDYISDDDLPWHSFVRYLGSWYDLSEVEIAPDDLKALGFDGWLTDSYFSATVFRYFDYDGHCRADDEIIVGRIHW